MFLVCHFKVKMTTEVLERVSIRDRWDRFVVYEKLKVDTEENVWKISLFQK